MFLLRRQYFDEPEGVMCFNFIKGEVTVEALRDAT